MKASAHLAEASAATSRRPTLPHIALALACASLVSGCASYRLGPTNGEAPRARSISVTPFQNETPEPRLEASVTTALRKHLQQDGTYRLSTRGDADIIVTGTIQAYRRSELSFVPTDVLTPRDYGLSIEATIEARDRLTGRVVARGVVAGQTTIRVGADLSSAERQALPLMAERMARNATSLLVDGTW